jgi:hypothetical protein
LIGVRGLSDERINTRKFMLMVRRGSNQRSENHEGIYAGKDTLRKSERLN